MLDEQRQYMGQYAVLNLVISGIPSIPRLYVKNVNVAKHVLNLVISGIPSILG